MRTLRRLFAPTAWVFYLALVFEIFFMISPFALYYYSSYAPALNLLDQSVWTAWLTGFFLPYVSVTTSYPLNHLHDVGEFLIGLGLVLFLIGFVQIYWAKLRRSGPVTRGLYAYIRHPQYLALAIMGQVGSCDSRSLRVYPPPPVSSARNHGAGSSPCLASVSGPHRLRHHALPLQDAGPQRGRELPAEIWRELPRLPRTYR